MTMRRTLGATVLIGLCLALAPAASTQAAEPPAIRPSAGPLEAGDGFAFAIGGRQPLSGAAAKLNSSEVTHTNSTPIDSLNRRLGEVGLPHRSGPPDLLARRFPRSGVHAATSPQ